MSLDAAQHTRGESLFTDDLPEPEGPEIPDTFEEFTRASSPRRAVPPRLLLGLLAVALMLIVARAAQLLFAA